MMKKISLLVFIIAIVSIRGTVEAQISFGVKGGLNISSVKLSKDIISSDNVTGFHIGPMVEMMLPFTGLGFDAAILYSQKGLDTELESITTDYIDVPVNVKWKFGLPIIKGFVAAGPYVGFRVGGDKLWEEPQNLANQIKAKSFGAGINIGAGVEVISHIQVGVNYGIGLTENYSIYKDGNSTEAKTRTWSISAALLF